jgi:hypothetical protein
MAMARASGLNGRDDSTAGAAESEILGAVTRTRRHDSAASEGIDQIGQELQVDRILESSMCRASNRVGVTAIAPNSRTRKLEDTSMSIPLGRVIN